MTFNRSGRLRRWHFSLTSFMLLLKLGEIDLLEPRLLGRFTKNLKWCIHFCVIVWQAAFPIKFNKRILRNGGEGCAGGGSG